MDEYERALNEFIEITSSINNEQFIMRWATDGRFSSISDILLHVCRAGYGYADYIRDVREMEAESPDKYIESLSDISQDLRSMFNYTLESVEGLYHLTESDVYAMMIPTWGDDVYHLEQLLEHGIVHILRHRRQIERILEGSYGSVQT